VVANRNAVGAWEEFRTEWIAQNRIALRAANGQYLCAEGGGGREVVENRNAVGTWETFEVSNQGSMVAVGTALSNSLRTLADQSAVPAAMTRVTGVSVQRDVLAAAAPAIEAEVDRVLRSGADLMTQAANTGTLPPMNAGYQVSLNPGGGKAARLTLAEVKSAPLAAALADDRTGWSTLDRTFAGNLTGRASGTARAAVKLVLEVTQAADGTLTVNLGPDSRIDISGIDAEFTLIGRGGFGELNDVSVSTRGQVTGQATVQLDGRPNALRPSADLDMKAAATTSLTSNDAPTRGVAWSVRDESRVTGTDVRASNSIYTSPKAVDLLKAAVRHLNGYRVTAPDAVLAEAQKVLDVKVPFTGKTLGEQIKFPTVVPLAINTVNPEQFSTFDTLAGALKADQRFAVLLQGENGATQFAQGKKVALVSVKAKLEKSESFTLAETARATYVILPGVTLSGQAKLEFTVKGMFEAVIVVDSRGLGLGEGSRAGLTIKLSGELKGELSVLEIGKLFSLLSGSAKAGAYVEGTATVTVGRPLDAAGNSNGNGVLYLGSAASANPPRPITDFLRVDTDLKLGVEASVKVSVLGIAVYKKEWDKSAVLARYTRLPKANLS